MQPRQCMQQSRQESYTLIYDLETKKYISKLQYFQFFQSESFNNVTKTVKSKNNYRDFLINFGGRSQESNLPGTAGGPNWI